jgi:hypothetical protein
MRGLDHHPRSLFWCFVYKATPAKYAVRNTHETAGKAAADVRTKVRVRVDTRRCANRDVTVDRKPRSRSLDGLPKGQLTRRDERIQEGGLALALLAPATHCD